MEILRSFANSIHRFYEHVEKHVIKVDELLKKAEKHCRSITNQCLILQSTLPKNCLEGTGLEQLPRFRLRLENSVLDSLNREFEGLLQIRDNIVTCDSDLLESYKSLEQSFRKIQEKKLVNSPLLNPASPRLEHILDWSLDIWRYYHGLTLQISIAIENINFENENSVSGLAEAFKEDKKLTEEVNRIRGFELHSFPFVE